MTAPTPVALTLLIPASQTGLTASGHPTFFWHLSTDVATPVEFTLVQPGNPTPLFVQQFPSLPAGITQVQMPVNLPELNSGQKYRWSVALVCNPLRRSGDVIAQAWIERVAPSSQIGFQLATTQSNMQQADLYAQDGLWYDALATLANALASQPDNQTILLDRLSLLEQVGLVSVAEQERQRLSLSSVNRTE